LRRCRWGPRRQRRWRAAPSLRRQPAGARRSRELATVHPHRHQCQATRQPSGCRVVPHQRGVAQRPRQPRPNRQRRLLPACPPPHARSPPVERKRLPLGPAMPTAPRRRRDSPRPPAAPDAAAACASRLRGGAAGASGAPGPRAARPAPLPARRRHPRIRCQPMSQAQKPPRALCGRVGRRRRAAAARPRTAAARQRPSPEHLTRGWQLDAWLACHLDDPSPGRRRPVQRQPSSWPARGVLAARERDAQAWPAQQARRPSAAACEGRAAPRAPAGREAPGPPAPHREPHEAPRGPRLAAAGRRRARRGGPALKTGHTRSQPNPLAASRPAPWPGSFARNELPSPRPAGPPGSRRAPGGVHGTREGITHGGKQIGRGRRRNGRRRAAGGGTRVAGRQQLWLLRGWSTSGEARVHRLQRRRRRRNGQHMRRQSVHSRQLQVGLLRADKPPGNEDPIHCHPIGPNVLFCIPNSDKLHPSGGGAAP
jgi:hypothetical protein